MGSVAVTAKQLLSRALTAGPAVEYPYMMLLTATCLSLKQTVSTFPLFGPVHRTHKHRLSCLLFDLLGWALAGGRLLLWLLLWLALLEAACWLLEAGDGLLYRAGTCLVLCLPLSSTVSACLCPVLSNITSLFLFATQLTAVTDSVKLKMEEWMFRRRSCFRAGGSSGLFSLMITRRVIPCRRRASPSSRLVKRLSQVTLWPSGGFSTRSSTTHWPRALSGLVPVFPRYSWICRRKWLSHTAASSSGYI